MKTESAEAHERVEAKDYYTVMIHFYRGELGRIMIWRQRLDVTTNWAIVGSTAMITFGLGSRTHSHLIFFFAHFLTFLLLTIEARRYRFYDAFRARVRMLEAHFIMPVMMREVSLLQGDWKRIMAEDLIVPSFKVSRFEATLKRFRRNYIWIFLLISGAWFVKIWIDFPEAHSFQGFLGALSGSLLMPAPAFWVMFGICYLVLGLLAVASFCIPEKWGEFSSKAMRRKKWMK